MKNFAYITLFPRIIVLFLLVTFISCGGDKSSGGANTCESSVAVESDLYGNWSISNIEGVSSNDPMASEFTFFSTGTYEWFFMIDSPSWAANIVGNGNYSFANSLLFIDGRFSETVISGNSVELSFCNNNTSFYFEDDNGDRWTYTKN